MFTFRLRPGRMAAVGAGGLAFVLLAATPALADTSASTASALNITLLGGGLASSGQTTASNDGTTETLTGNQFPAIAVLGAQPVIQAGVLGQVSRAFNDGTSAACAGVLGVGGLLTVGPDGTCIATPGAQVVLNLGVVGLATITLRATAIYAECTASSAPSTSGSATLVGASIVSTIAGIDTTLLNLPVTPGPNTGLATSIVTLALNTQPPTAPGVIDVTALQISLLGGLVTSIDIGAVTCGPNAIAPPVPTIPLAGAPIAAGLVALFATGGFLWRRRRLAMAQD